MIKLLLIGIGIISAFKADYEGFLRTATVALFRGNTKFHYQAVTDHMDIRICIYKVRSIIRQEWMSGV